MDYIKKHYIWLIHIAFWITYFFLNKGVVTHVSKNEDLALMMAFVNLSVTIPIVYFFLIYLLPKYWDTKRFGLFFIWFIGLVIVSGLLRFSIMKVISYFIFPGIEGFFNREFLFQLTNGGVFFLILSIPLRFFDIYKKKNKIESEFKTHQLEAELRFLKAQVNPHFLFNALNNIYSLSFTESKLAPEMILKLSDMMSFMLYDCKEDNVPLESEIAYLNNYIALQQLKKDGEQNISLEVEGDPSGIQLTPMLFIPFYENAFKHGNIEDPTIGSLNSKFKVENGHLVFEISNTKPLEKKRFDNGGVGLENVKKRLDLLYPGAHSLDINEDDRKYHVQLTIDINKIKFN